MNWDFLKVRHRFAQKRVSAPPSWHRDPEAAYFAGIREGHRRKPAPLFIRLSNALGNVQQNTELQVGSHDHYGGYGGSQVRQGPPVKTGSSFDRAPQYGGSVPTPVRISPARPNAPVPAPAPFSFVKAVSSPVSVPGPAPPAFFHKPAPIPFQQTVPVAVQQTAPVTLKQTAPATFQQSAPAAFKQSAPATFQQSQQSAPVTFQQSAHIPFQNPPVPVHQSTPITFQQTAPVALEQHAPQTVQKAAPVTFQQAAPATFHQAAPATFKQAAPATFQQTPPASFQQTNSMLILNLADAMASSLGPSAEGLPYLLIVPDGANNTPKGVAKTGGQGPASKKGFTIFIVGGTDIKTHHVANHKSAATAG
ncbi:proteoglycan 4-like [Penaeus chinensis]|uniref:proteoglycan 4-like n=1 Tax=Penaeus chinensis TaxID=139456 RepID=UPI001FB5841C|nr:proteoglycan 4-like [Penaeus chinensis]